MLRNSIARRASSVKIAVAAAALVAAAVLAGCAGRALTLVVEAGDGRLLHDERVKPGDAFVIDYVHSSEHVAVRGVFVVHEDRGLRVVETSFGGFGPGLPELRSGDDWRIASGAIVHRPDAAPLDELAVRVAPLTRHRLALPSGAALDLSELMGTGGLVRVRAR